MPVKETRAYELLEERYRLAAGAVVRRLREERAWSYRDFGEQVGVSHTALYSIERAETIPAIHTLAGIAGACDLTLPALLSLITDELGDGTPAGSLGSVLEAARGLREVQRREVLNFIDYLKFRDRDLGDNE